MYYPLGIKRKGREERGSKKERKKTMKILSTKQALKKCFSFQQILSFLF
jgi:hypothetical protein